MRMDLFCRLEPVTIFLETLLLLEMQLLWEAASLCLDCWYLEFLAWETVSPFYSWSIMNFS